MQYQTASRPRHDARPRSANRRRHYLEALESRTLLSATLYITGPSTVSDSTHFQTLQSALTVALPGDTIVLQKGFSLGNFNSTFLAAPANAGDSTIHTLAPLEVGQVITIGTTSSADPAERVLVTGVSATTDGDFLITLANPLLAGHVGSKVDATNASSIGKTIGIDKGITLTAEADVVLPFNIALWKNTTGATLSNLNLSSFPATSLILESGAHHNTLSNITVANQMTLTGASDNTFTNVTVGNRFFVDAGSANNLVTLSNLKQVVLRPGSHDNTFTSSVIGSLTATTNSLTISGDDTFLQNTFTGMVKITGNFAAETNDLFAGNTFSLDSGDALTLLRADGTTLMGNTFTLAKDFARAIVIGDSAHVRVAKNRVTSTGLGGIGLLAYADVASTSLTVTENIFTTTSGTGIAFGKFNSSVSLEAGVQENDLRNNAIGVSAWGDGTSAGNIDLGGGSTSFGTSTGNNDFSSFAGADDSHYAIGVFNTSPDYGLLAKENKFAGVDPMSVVADGSHDLAALGSGTVLATAAISETLVLTPSDFSAIAMQQVHRVLAHFTSTLPRTADGFTVSVTTAGGVMLPATVVENPGGGFDIVLATSFTTPGDYPLSISLSSEGGASASGTSLVTITPRTLAASAPAMSVEKGSSFSGSIARFTDNLPGTTAADYTVTVTWSDGQTSTATVSENGDGSFSVNTSRPFNSMGNVTATITISAADGSVATTLTQDYVVTTKNGKVPPGKKK